MTAEREGRRVRQDRAEPSLHFDGGPDKGTPKAGSRPAGAWKKTAARMRAEPRQETAEPSPGDAERVSNAPGASLEVPRSDGAAPMTTADTGDCPRYRQQSSREAASGQSVPKRQPFRQESRQARPADKLRHDGDAVGGSSGGSGTDSTPEQDPLRKARLRMENQRGKADAARERLARQKPYKPPGPVRRAVGLAGRGVHGYVHGKIYQVERENVGVEGAHRAELTGEAAGGKALRFIRDRIRTHPARAARRAENRAVKAAADYQFQRAAQGHPELSKNALHQLGGNRSSGVTSKSRRGQRPDRARKWRKKQRPRRERLAGPPPVLSGGTLRAWWPRCSACSCWWGCSPAWSLCPSLETA